MSYSLLIREEANNEFAEAYVWYEQQQVNLGERFAETLKAKFADIQNNPYHYQKIYKEFRHAKTDKFPFVIIYLVNKSAKEIIVTAIFHTSRNPKAKFRYKPGK